MMHLLMTETISIAREEYEQMKLEIETLRHTKLYTRLLAFEENIQKKKYSQKDLGF